MFPETAVLIIEFNYYLVYHPYLFNINIGFPVFFYLYDFNYFFWVMCKPYIHWPSYPTAFHEFCCYLLLAGPKWWIWWWTWTGKKKFHFMPRSCCHCWYIFSLNTIGIIYDNLNWFYPKFHISVVKWHFVYFFSLCLSLTI